VPGHCWLAIEKVIRQSLKIFSVVAVQDFEELPSKLVKLSVKLVVPAPVFSKFIF